MVRVPDGVTDFLSGRRIVVAGVSRNTAQTANAVFRKLQDSGYEVVPVNPNAIEVEGVMCYPDLASVDGEIDGVMAVTHPEVAADLVRQCAERRVGRMWFHRAMGTGSVSAAAVVECRMHNIRCIVGGCPLMYVEPVDTFHRCFRWFLRFGNHIPG